MLSRSVVQFGIICSLIFPLIACKKQSGTTNNTGGGNNGTCLLTQFQFGGFGPFWNFEYNTKGKLSKTRYFSNGPILPATRVFEYDGENRLVKITDSSSPAYYTEFSAHSPTGNPTSAIAKFNNKKAVQINFVYDGKDNIIKKIFQFYDINEVLSPAKDTLQFYYDGNGNITKETVITTLNGVKREYILLEAEGYDNKTSFYKSLGKEFNFLYRFNRSGEGTYNLGEYIYGISANNPGKVFLHNQGTDDMNKGDYLTYVYEYNSNGYPSKISQSLTNSTTTYPATQSRLLYECK